MRFPQPGEVFAGRYRVAEVLGTGGFATVFAAFDASDRAVALKIATADERGAYSPALRARFAREVKMLGQLRDPHTIRLFDFGESPDGLLFMVFEHLPGQDLSDIVRAQGRLAPEVVIRILRQLLSSLREAHRLGLLHRDVKPENVRVFEYLGDPWNVKLLDFGVARPLGESAITKAGALVGTPRYMAPEQLTNRELSPASDLYSLGLLALELLAGADVLAGSSVGHQIDRLQSGHLMGQPILKTVDPGLMAVIGQMCAIDPDRRFQSADEVLAALDRLAAVPAAAARSSESVSLARIVEREDARRVWVKAAVAATLVLLVGALAFGIYVVRQADSNTAPAYRAVRVVRPAIVQPVATPPAPDDAGQAAPDLMLDAAIPSGCGKAPPFRGAGTLSHVDDLSMLTWPTYVPRKYDPTHRHALVFLFHQDLQTAGQVMVQSNFATLAESHDLIVVVPSSSGKLAWRTEADIADVELMMVDTAKALCIDDSRIFAVGHGSGGGAAERLACKPWISAVVTTSYRSEHLHFLCPNDRAVAHLQVNATKGTRMPINGGLACGRIPKISLDEAEARWAKRNDCRGKRQRIFHSEAGDCYRWDGCAVETQSCQSHGGHGWPGGVGDMHEFDVLNCDPPAGPFEATKQIGEFFARLDK